MTARRRRTYLRRLGCGGLLVAALVVSVRLATLRGWLRPVRVVSGSMAEGLWGDHYRVTCGDCGFPFAFGEDSLPPRGVAVCPNCGYDGNDIHDGQRRRGNRVWIDRAAYWLAAPRRFDRVSFDHPENPGQLVVKRVAGLPGERLVIRGGELFADGRWVRKSLAEFRDLSVMVHDAAFHPRRDPGIPGRWRSLSADSRWRVDRGGLCYSPVQENSPAPRDADCLSAGAAAGACCQPLDAEARHPAPAMDWVSYHHWRCYASSHERTDEAAVADNSGYNQGESRALREVLDLVASCRVVSQGSGKLVLRVHSGWDDMLAWIDPGRRQVVVEYGGCVLETVAFPTGADPHAVDVEWGVLDGQLVLGLDGVEQLRREYPRPTHPPHAVVQPVGIGGQDLAARIENLVIRRDVHWLDVGNVGSDWELTRRLGPDEYLMLGDNASLSEDSRQWNRGIEREAIRGKVLLWHW